MDNKIVKTCKTHGELTIEQTRTRKDKPHILKCFLCMQERLKANYLKNRDARLIQTAKYREANRERLAEWARSDRKNNPEKYKAQHTDGYGRGYSKRLYDLLTSYGLTKEQYDLMLLNQNNCCFICKRPETRIDPHNNTIARLCIDHDHDTNKVRALLCHSCNGGIGYFRENTESMQKAIAYVIKHSEAA